VGIVAAFRDWICRHAGDRELQGVGAMAVLVEHDATGWAYSQLSKGVNESRGKLRIIRTVVPADELPEAAKKEGMAVCRPPDYW
jgi:hypothetical protein